jgi:hypothetical protein
MWALHWNPIQNNPFILAVFIARYTMSTRILPYKKLLVDIGRRSEYDIEIHSYDKKSLWSWHRDRNKTLSSTFHLSMLRWDVKASKVFNTVFTSIFVFISFLHVKLARYSAQHSATFAFIFFLEFRAGCEAG